MALARVRPIQEFGIYTGMGVVVAFLVTFLLLPALLYLLPLPLIAQRSHNRQRWRGSLQAVLLYILRRQRGVLISFGLVGALSLLGLWHLQVNAYLIDDLPRSHPLKRDFSYMDEHFGGARPLEMALWNVDSSTVWSWAALQRMDEIEQRLKTDLGLGSVVSPTALVKAIHQGLLGGSWKHYVLPDSQAYQRCLPYLEKSFEATGKPGLGKP
ncbi:MAG: MMPL family transporter [Cytophagales bacterium]|nr:MMPL family transporter [Cytophagales bacterium]